MQDHNGTIENEELHGFLKDLMELVQQDYDSDDIAFMRHAILDQWDLNRDGRINKSELSMLLLQQSRMAQEEEGTTSASTEQDTGE
ncbi:hypothetical protein LSH36_1204g01006 [Paralvinella palmiformis]|uniref:EF-hand domain-containing protein n=1 Tax=Paralvinella palmiformis TaxID=53620 RepID=A0AAD9IUR5_9ANNE|nr:hypothetical protein LSH36_1204g01006 [Paralvinella palmiformis]